MTDSKINPIAIEANAPALKVLTESLKSLEESGNSTHCFDAGYYVGLYRAVLPIEQICLKLPRISNNLNEGRALDLSGARSICFEYLRVTDCKGPVAAIVLDLLDLTSAFSDENK